MNEPTDVEIIESLKMHRTIASVMASIYQQAHHLAGKSLELSLHFGTLQQASVNVMAEYQRLI